MGIVIRQSFWGVFFGYLGVLIGFINAMFLMPKFMSPDEIGLWRTLASIAGFISPFIMVGSAGTITKFLPNYDPDTRATILKNLSYRVGTAFIVFALFAIVFKGEISKIYDENGSDIQNYVYFIILLILAMMVFSFMEAISRANLNISTPNLIREVVYKSGHLLIIGLFGLNLINFKGYLMLQLVLHTFLIALILPILKKQNVQWFSRVRLSDQLKKDLNTYGWFAILNGLGIAFILHIDKMMVANFLGLNEVAVYTTAIFITTVIGMTSRYVVQISMPIITRAFNDHQLDKIDNHYKASSINQFIFSSFIFLIIFLNIREIYDLMPNGHLYKEGASIVLIIGISKMIENIFGINGAIIEQSQYYRFNTLMFLLIGILNFSLNWLLIPLFGMNGPALATLISFTIFNIAKYLLLKWKFNFTPFTPMVFFSIFFVSALAVSLFYFDLGINHTILRIVVKSGIIAASYFGFVLIVKPSTEIQQIIQTISKQLRFK